VARPIRFFLEVTRDAGSSHFLDAERREPVRGQDVRHGYNHGFHAAIEPHCAPSFDPPVAGSTAYFAASFRVGDEAFVASVEIPTPDTRVLISEEWFPYEVANSSN
jgi:hypothetical protein